MFYDLFYHVILFRLIEIHFVVANLIKQFYYDKYSHDKIRFIAQKDENLNCEQRVR